MHPPPRYMTGYEYAMQAQALAGRPIPMHPQSYPIINHAMHNENMRSSYVDQDLSHLDEDIMKCEEQLKVLLKMRALKERYHGLRR